MKGLYASRLALIFPVLVSSHPVLADIDLVGSPTLSSTTDVTLSSSADLSSMEITQHTLDGWNVTLTGNGTVGQAGTLYLGSFYLNDGDLLVDGGSTVWTAYSSFNAFNADASVTVSGAGTTYISDDIDLTAQSGYQSVLTIADGADVQVADTITTTAGTTININNSTVSAVFQNYGTINVVDSNLTTRFGNLGTINIAGSSSNVNLTDDFNSFGNFNLSDGATLWAPTLTINYFDHITATGAGTRLSADVVQWWGDGQITITGGAEFNANTIYLQGEADQPLLEADGQGTTVQITDLYMMGFGEQAVLSVTDGATVSVLNNTTLDANSVINIDNGVMDILGLDNQGTINVSGSQGRLTHSSGLWSQGYGRINFSEGTEYSISVLYTYAGDVVTATDLGTRVIASEQLRMFGGSATFTDGATLEVGIRTDIIAGWEDTSLVLDGAGTALTGNADIIIEGYPAGGYNAELRIRNDAEANVGNVQMYAGSSLVLENGGKLSATAIVNQDTIQALGANNLIVAPSLQNDGIIAIDGSITVQGDINVADGAGFEFTVIDNTVGPAMVLEGQLTGDGLISIGFDASNIADPTSDFSMDLLLFASIAPADLSLFDIDLGAFAGWSDNWKQSVSLLGNTIVLNVYSQVPLPGGIYLMLSALVTLLVQQRKTRAKFAR